MFCEKCGARVDDGQPFCPNCGNRMGAPAPAPASGAVPPRAPGYGAGYRAPVARAPRPAMDLGKLFMLIAMGLLLLAIICSLFKTASVTTYPVDSEATRAAQQAALAANPQADISNIAKYGAGQTSAAVQRSLTPILVNINLGVILCLAFLLFGVVKNHVVPALLGSALALTGFFYVFNTFLSQTDRNRADTTAKISYGFSVWGWIVLIFEFAACVLCILSCLGHLKGNKR